MPSTHTTSDRIVDIAYSSITLGSSVFWGVLSGWLIYDYLPPTGRGTPLVPIAFYSAVLLLTRLVNLGVTFPIGILSDNTHTRWGRRLPYIFLSSLLLPGAFLLIWRPPIPRESGWNLLFLAAVMLLFNTAYSFRQIPFEALLPELAPSDDRRVRISAWQAGFQLLGVVFAGFAGPLIEQKGYQGTAWVYVLLILPTLFLPFFFLREPPAPPRPLEKRLSLKQSALLTFTNRPFQIFIVAWGLFWIASTLILETIPYIVTEICLQPESSALYFYLPPVIASLLCFPIVTRLSRRFGKKRVFSASLLATALVMPLLFFIGPGLPLPPLLQGVVWITLQAVTLSGAQVLPPAIAAEITDLDEKLTGQRRAGSFYAAWGLFDQLTSSLALACLPLLFLLGRGQADPNGPLGVRVAGVLAGALLLLAYLVFRHYPQNTHNS